MDLELRKFNYPEEFNSYLELFNDAFPEVGGGSKQRFEWLLHGYPTQGPKSYEYAAYIGNEMVGFYAAVPYQYKIGGKAAPVGMVCGVMTSSKHRGKGIFTKLGHYSTEAMGEYVPFLTGYPIRSAVIPGHLKVGWKIAFELPLYARVIKSNSFLASKGLKGLSFVLNPFLGIYNSIRNLHVNKEYLIEIFDSVNNLPFGLIWDSFICAWNAQVENHLVKDEAFMKWRYTRPGNTYHFIVVKERGNIVSFAAMRFVEKLGVPTLCIMDMMTTDTKSLHFLHRSVFDLAKNGKAEIILTMMSKKSAKDCRLTSNAFIKTNNVFKLIVKNLTHEFSDSELLSENSWHLMWVDSDDL